MALKTIGFCICIVLLCDATETRAERFTYTVGGNGASWSEMATRWVALDDTTAPGSVQPKELMPGENLMHGEGEETNIYGLQWAVNKQTGLEVFGLELGLNPRIWGAAGLTALASNLIIDGDETTAFQTLRVVDQEEFNSHASLTGGAYSAGFRLDYQEAFTFDLGIVSPINRIRFFPRQNGLDAFGVPNARRAPQGFELSVQREPENHLLLEQETTPWRPLETVLLRTVFNSESIVDLEFPLQPVRFIRLNVGIMRQDYSLAEFEVYGHGVPPNVEYVSDVIDLGQAVNFGQIDFALTLLRRTEVGELVEDPQSPVSLSLQTRTGHDDSPLAYWVINEVGADVEVPKKEYERADTPKSCCLDLRLPGMQSAITDDVTQWTPWSSPYSNSGEENRSADGRRYLQFRFNLRTEDVLSFGRLDSLVFHYSSLLSQAVISEISLFDAPQLEIIEAPAGEEKRFALDIAADFAAEGQRGFDGVRLDMPSGGRFVRLEMGPADGNGPLTETAPDSIREESGELHVFFPSNRISPDNNRPLRIVLDVAIFNSNTVFTGDVLDSQSDNLPQSIEAGDANSDVASNSLKVFAIGGSLSILSDVEVKPRVLTPNGDNVNDQVAITYQLLAIERGAVEIGIFDLHGRQLRQLSPGLKGQGKYTEFWDGKDAAGTLVVPGIYLCKVVLKTESGEKENTKLISVIY